MENSVKVIRLDNDTNPASYNGVEEGHGTYDPKDMRTTTIGDLKTWICRDCVEFKTKGIKEGELEIGLPYNEDTLEDDDMLLWCLSGEEENKLHVWQKPQAGYAKALDLINKPHKVRIASDKERRIICPKVGHIKREHYLHLTIFPPREGKNFPKYQPISANLEELYLFIGDDINPDETNGVHVVRQFKIPRAIQKVFVKSDPNEDPSIDSNRFTLNCYLEGEETPSQIDWEEGLEKKFADDHNYRNSIFREYVKPSFQMFG